ncbi:MAG: hypothetical protein RBR40_15815 [Tenuifilaceae bacterium]|jgi:hypothetical protein|nr:hypothetical protein [Tenuifilaceae bacterium]
MDKILFRMKTPGSASKKMRFVSFSGALFQGKPAFSHFGKPAARLVGKGFSVV